MSQEPWTDEDESALATKRPSGGWRYGPKDRVVLSGKGLVVGIVVADAVFFLFWAIPSWSLNPNHASYTLAMTATAMVIGLIPIGVVGTAVGWPLGVALRSVRNQWLHVAAFFAAGAIICVPFGGFWSPSAWAFPLSIAVAAGVGRLAVWKLVRINHAGEPK
ncbi:hypothetical protein [Paenarthrobacter aurescens]|uniref:Uncharacterized protein n=1 Tax=Paenarthrobacter aurescens TaxID=43663 RepID=A0A4Y3NIN3_PAEAU|nr:hypothetical protein [Paenarthrobacter aurescens]MDO6142343.1 hypothetical protein [Paenarthrobacter aurescens]MDO6146190.1 hypothetical protein [Paenarthrobacter aurescens]MDO6157435.1 hypothetical protein [Paenarthrobacter aurescens]MDO6161420.1 hypothetical protein [Paenarthrobacter aurescens]GEB18938.1 hypothetical protein AAU01_16930 [Paenarthrobacter aurescens]